jgi:cysteinyl-tRNA synthetase
MKLHNTLSRTTEDIQPHEGNKIKLYTCGLTVYSQPHIGNWVAYIYWDVLVRTLKASGYDVTRVQNITDVGHLTSDEDAGEDKMLKGALKEGLTAWQVAEKYIQIADDEAYNKLGLIIT